MKYLDEERTSELVAETKRRLDTKEPLIFKGTLAEWEELSEEEQDGYSMRMITDDGGGDVLVVDSITKGDKTHAPSGNAVYNGLRSVKNEYFFDANTAHSSDADYRVGFVSALNSLGIQATIRTQFIMIRYSGGYYASFVVMTDYSDATAKILIAHDNAYEGHRFTAKFSNGTWS